MDGSIVHAVVPHYAFRVYEWRWNEADRCHLFTDTGRKVLRLERDEVLTSRRGELLDALARERFRRTPRYIRTVHADSLLFVRDYVCTVADDLAFRPVTDSLPDSVAAAVNLAQAHAALQRVSEATVWRARGQYSPYALSTRLREAKKILQMVLLSEEDTPFVRRYRTIARALLQRAARAESALIQAGMIEREANPQFGQWTLGGYHASMVVWTSSGTMATLDFDHIAWGDPEWDLYSYSRYLYERGLAELLPHVADAYAQARGDEGEGNGELRKQRIIGFVGFPFAIAQAARDYLQSEDRTDMRHVTALQTAYKRDFPAKLEK